MFVLDASGSIEMSDFKKQLQFTRDVVNIFDIEPDRTRVGILSFRYNFCYYNLSSQEIDFLGGKMCVSYHF